jgi:hypothetical protein
MRSSTALLRRTTALLVASVLTVTSASLMLATASSASADDSQALLDADNFPAEGSTIGTPVTVSSDRVRPIATFTVGKTGMLTHASALMRLDQNFCVRMDPSLCGITFRLGPIGAGAKPGVLDLNQTVFVPMARLNGDYNAIDVPFAAPVPVVAGQQYQLWAFFAGVEVSWAPGVGGGSGWLEAEGFHAPASVDPLPPLAVRDYVVPALAITSHAPPAGKVGVPYVFSLTGSRRVSSWAVTSGALPDGLSLDPVTGVISGQPRSVSPGSGITVTATDLLGGTASTTFNLRVRADTTPPVITCATHTPLMIGRPGVVPVQITDTDSPAYSRVELHRVDTTKLGIFHVHATATDQAGNVARHSCEYGVGYRIQVLSPTPRTAVTGQKTIPVKVQLRTGSGALVSHAVAKKLAAGCQVGVAGSAPRENCLSYRLASRTFVGSVVVNGPGSVITFTTRQANRRALSSITVILP